MGRIQRNATRLAINVAKILGIIAALITIRFVLQAIHRGVLGEDSSCSIKDPHAQLKLTRLRFSDHRQRHLS